MTLTHVCNTPWADAAQVEDGWFPVRNNGLSDFGLDLVIAIFIIIFLVKISSFNVFIL